MELFITAFSKRVNSTKIPDISTMDGATVEGILKDASGVISPTIDILLPQDSNIPAYYNYAYIPVFERYYYIREWTWNGSLWSVSMECDTLASWRTDIGNSRQYVLRASAEYNGSILDTFYPATTQTIMDVVPFTGAFQSWSSGSGSFIIGIINNDADKVGCTTYYAMSSTQFDAFTSVLLNDSASWINIDPSELSIALQKALVNPMQYIVSVAWFPFAVRSGTAVDSIPFGWWSVSATALRLNANQLLYKTFHTLNTPKHPDSTTRGFYLNCAPYSRYTLYYPPWGEIPLDTVILQDNTAIDINIGVDLISGLGTLVVSTGTGEVLGYFNSPVSVPINIAQTVTDFKGIANSVVEVASGAGSIASSIIQRDIGEAVSGIGTMASGIISGVYASAPQVRSNGLTGSLSAYDYVPHLRAQFFRPVDEDNADYGRPLCAVRQINTIPGFILVAHPEFNSRATVGENESIIAAMAGGFYYE